MDKSATLSTARRRSSDWSDSSRTTGSVARLLCDRSRWPPGQVWLSSTHVPRMALESAVDCPDHDNPGLEVAICEETERRAGSGNRSANKPFPEGETGMTSNHLTRRTALVFSAACPPLPCPAASRAEGLTCRMSTPGRGPAHRHRLHRAPCHNDGVQRPRHRRRRCCRRPGSGAGQPRRNRVAHRRPALRRGRPLCRQGHHRRLIDQHVHPVLGALTITTEVIAIEDWDLPTGFSAAALTPEAYLSP